MDEGDIECCPYCGQEVSHLPPDSLSYCNDCDQLVEGNTVPAARGNSVHELCRKTGVWAGLCLS